MDVQKEKKAFNRQGIVALLFNIVPLIVLILTAIKNHSYEGKSGLMGYESFFTWIAGLFFFFFFAVIAIAILIPLFPKAKQLRRYGVKHTPWEKICLFTSPPFCSLFFLVCYIRFALWGAFFEGFFG